MSDVQLDHTALEGATLNNKAWMDSLIKDEWKLQTEAEISNLEAENVGISMLIDRMEGSAQHKVQIAREVLQEVLQDNQKHIDRLKAALSK